MEEDTSTIQEGHQKRKNAD